MTEKLRTMRLACLMIGVGMMGVAAAAPFIPPGGLAAIGPDTGPCVNPQAYGWGGSAAGSNTDYHRYANGGTVGVLDGCDGFAPLSWPGCVEAAARGDAGNALPHLINGVRFLDESEIHLGVAKLGSGAGNLYRKECGFASKLTDGEFEYGNLQAYLNVRSGSGPDYDADGLANGDGFQRCYFGVGKGTAHHAGDDEVYVLDLVHGGKVAFTVVADWGRPAAISRLDVDENDAPGLDHCGDGIAEPCPPNTPNRIGLLAEASQMDDFTGVFTLLIGDGGAGGAGAGYLPVLPNDVLTSADLADWQLWFNGCNNLDVVKAFGPGAGAVAGGSLGQPLANFGQGGADGVIHVFISAGTNSTISYNTGNLGGSVVVQCSPDASALARLCPPTGYVLPPTLGWVWTG